MAVDESERETTVRSFKEYVENIERYCPDLRVKGGSLIKKRDTHLLVSPQTCVLPAPPGKYASHDLAV